jgi:tetratricopeptide (TPR) repeat protein
MLLTIYSITIYGQIVTEKDGFQWREFTEDGYKGVKSTKDKIIIPAFYEDIKYKNGCFLVKSDKSCLALYSRKGKNLTSKFGSRLAINNLEEVDDLWKIVNENLLYSVIDKEGNEIIKLSEGYSYLKLEGDKNNGFYFDCSKDGYDGIISLKGKVIIPPNKYKHVRREGNRKEGFYYLFNIYGNNLACGVCEENGKELFRLPFRRIFYKNDNGRIYFTVEHGNSRGEIDINGNIIKSPKPYDGIVYKYYDEKYNEIRTKDGYYGVSDANGKIIVPPEFDFITIKRNDMFYGFEVTKGIYEGIYNTKGECIIKPDLYYLASIGKSNEIWCKNDEIYSLYDENGKKIIDDYTSNVHRVVIDGDTAYTAKSAKKQKWAIFNERGKQLTPYKYDGCETYRYKSLGLVHEVEKNGRYGICDKNGNEIVPPYYTKTKIEIYKNGVKICKVFDGKNVGAYNTNGDLLIPSEYFTSLVVLETKFRASNGEWQCDFSFDGRLLSDNKKSIERDNFIKEADIEFEKKNYKKAASLYKNAIKLRPSSSLYFNVAVSYYNNSKYNDAIDYFKLCLSNNPSQNLIDRSKNLIIKARQLQAEKITRREQTAANIFGLVLGVAAAYTQSKLSSSSNSYNKTSYQMNRNLDYLLDPSYTVNQVQSENWMEYIRDTNGGKTMSYDEWYANIKSPAIRAANSGKSGDTSYSSSSGSSNSSSSTYSASCKFCHGTKTCETCDGAGKVFVYGAGKWVDCVNCKDGVCSHCNGTGKQ